MVETTAYPRPAFSTFLRSDNNAGGDGLRWYDHQRLLRSKKVSLLQEKQAQSRGSGLGGAGLRQRGWSRRVYEQPEPSVLGSRLSRDNDSSGLEQQPRLPAHTFAKGSSTSEPRVVTRKRSVKSAHARSTTWPAPLARSTARPKTAGCRTSGGGASTLVSDAVQTEDSACVQRETSSGECVIF